MNKVKIGFFSFTEITDPGEHRAYNEWHQLDHMPEQFPIAGIAGGERWVSTPACREARRASDPELDPIHYVTLYLITEPVERTISEFTRWGEQLATLGRFHRHRRSRLGGPHLVSKGWAAPRVRVSPEAIPFRPARGVYVSVVEAVGDEGLDDYARWLEREHVPALLEVPGVAGVWLFTAHSDRFLEVPDGRRILVCWLDDAPLEVAARLDERQAAWKSQGKLPDWSATVRTTFAGPLETITPWQWDWFEDDTAKR